MEERIREAVAAALATAGGERVAFAVEWPTELAHGDYAVNAAMAAAKSLGKNPRELAEELAPRIQETLGADVERVEVAGPGFINITLSRSALDKEIGRAASGGAAWGMGTANAGRRVAVEYSCPNPFKEMHIGHLMSTVIGEAISRLVECEGAKVTRDTYGGDVGPHVAKALWALREKGITEPASAKEIGDAYAHGSRSYEESEKAKGAIDALNVKLYGIVAKDVNDLDEDERALFELWRIGREISVEAFRDIYRILGTRFDYFIFESETTPIGIEVVADALAKGILEKSDGAVIYNGERKGLHTLVFLTSRGTPTYEAKELGLAFLKEERIPNDESYILTAAEQVGHFKVALAALEEIAPLVAAKTHHVPHGFLRLSTGKMSSREGNVITAEGLLRDVMEIAAQKNDDPLIAEQVAVGAVKYMILRASPGSDIVFDAEKSLSLEGDSGPYLQYALVRARSVLAQAKEQGRDSEGADASQEPYVLARLIARFPEVVARAASERAPQQLVTYLTQLASEWNSFYAKERIIGADREAYKLLLAEAFVATMQNGLGFLGIPAPEKM